MISRIVVVGTSGSGKTTLAKALAQKLGIKHIELDELHWDPNWTEVPDEVMRERVVQAVRIESWTVDGNYKQVRDLVWQRAQMLVWLDYSFAVVFGRALRRTIRRIFTREELWNGNREKLGMLFSKESILLWVIQTHSRRAKEYPSLLKSPQYQHLIQVRLRSPKETARWLASLQPPITPQ
jgi:adenylate kinase family enzyme